MKEFMKIQVGDEISFQTKNSQKKGILLNKKYPIKDIFNVNEYETDTYNEGDWKCIAFIGENKRRVVFRNNIKNINSYKFSIHKRDEKKEFKWTDEKVKDFSGTKENVAWGLRQSTPMLTLRVVCPC